MTKRPSHHLNELTTSTSKRFFVNDVEVEENDDPTPNSDDILQTSLDCIQPSMNELESAGYESINYTGTHF